MALVEVLEAVTVQLLATEFRSRCGVRNQSVGGPSVGGPLDAISRRSESFLIACDARYLVAGARSTISINTVHGCWSGSGSRGPWAEMRVATVAGWLRLHALEPIAESRIGADDEICARPYPAAEFWVPRRCSKQPGAAPHRRYCGWWQIQSREYGVKCQVSIAFQPFSRRKRSM